MTHEKKPGPALPPPHEHGDEARADALLVKQGIAASRAAAQTMIEAGRVTAHVNGRDEPVVKSSQLLPEHANLRVHPAEQETP